LARALAAPSYTPSLYGGPAAPMYGAQPVAPAAAAPSLSTTDIEMWIGRREEERATTMIGRNCYRPSRCGSVGAKRSENAPSQQTRN
jgi:hypothetical protein